MDRRLDDVFSVERLRRSWSAKGSEPPGPAAPEAASPVEPSLQARQVLQDMRGLASRRLSAAGRAPLEALIGQAEDLLERMRPQEALSSLTSDEIQELNRSLISTLDDLEELIEALELAEPERGA